MYIGDDDYGDPIYSERCYDDGENLTYSDYVNANAGDADLAGGLLPPDALGAIIGKDNIDYDAWTKEAMTPEAQSAIQKMIDSRADPSLIGKMLNAFKTDGKYDWAKIATAGVGLYTALKNQSNDTGGYNVPIPKLEAVTQQIQYNDPNRRPGSMGRQYTTDPRYVKEGDAASLASAKAISDAQAAGILAAYKPVAAPAANPWAGKMKTPWNPSAATTGAMAGSTTNAANSAATGTTTPAATGIAAALPVMPTNEQLMDPNYKIPMASGGIAMAKGRYLRGGTDGMADKIPTSIDGDQPAALSHGEFVVPADVVSHLGNGNSDAGAEKLYQMMDRIRQARTGTKQQGKKINPDKFMPGGLAASKYAKGGKVMGFIEGGGVPLDTSKTSTLSPWAGDYVTNMLGKTQALTSAPMQTYGGPLTAGASDLQQQGFAGISDIASAGYQPGTFTNQFKAPTAYSPTTSSFDTAAASQYMNPYLQTALNPQLDEARRQSQITQQQNAAKMTQAGAFGGGRQAILDAETQRALGANLANITGTGYSSAYDKATQQFNADQQRKMQEAQFGAGQGMTAAQNTAQYGDAAQRAAEESRRYSADYGLKSLSDLMAAGATQRGIESEGITADKRQFEEQQARPYTNLEFQRKMVEGLPIGASTTAVNQDTLSKIQSDIGGLASLYDKLSKLGIKV
jgi:hypothetical protein